MSYDDNRLRWHCCTHRPLSSSFLGLPYRILKISHKKELLRGLWVDGKPWQVLLFKLPQSDHRRLFAVRTMGGHVLPSASIKKHKGLRVTSSVQNYPTAQPVRTMMILAPEP